MKSLLSIQKLSGGYSTNSQHPQKCHLYLYQPIGTQNDMINTRVRDLAPLKNLHLCKIRIILARLFKISPYSTIRIVQMDVERQI